MKILVTGAKGQVGSEITKLFFVANHEVVAVSRKELDCFHLDKVHATLERINPDLIINAAAYTAVDKAEDEAQLVHVVNTEFVRYLAQYCSLREIPLIHLSTDYVFDGLKEESYTETDTPNPQGVYAQSKFAGEQAILSQLKEHIILRVSWVFGIYGSNFVKTILNLASTREELRVVSDQWGKPTAARDIARALLKVVEKMSQPGFSEWGIYHYAGEGKTNWYEFAKFFIQNAEEKDAVLTLKNLIPIKSEEYITKVNRPANSVLDTAKIQKILGIQPHDWRNYLAEVIDQFILRTRETASV